MDFRRALSADAELLTQLAIASKRYWDYSDEFMDAVQAELVISAEQISSGYCEVAQIDDVAVGFVLLLENIDYVELEALFVAPKFIGSGVGNKLLSRSFDWAKANGHRIVRTTADPNATGFYEKHGFVKIAEIVSESISGRKLPRLERDLHAV